MQCAPDEVTLSGMLYIITIKDTIYVDTKMKFKEPTRDFEPRLCRKFMKAH